VFCLLVFLVKLSVLAKCIYYGVVSVEQSNVVYVYAVVTTTIRLRFDCNSAARRTFDDLRYASLPVSGLLQWLWPKINGKKRSEETQTLPAGCSKAEPKLFAPPQTPFPGARDGQIKSAGDGHYLYLQTQFGEARCTQFRVIVVTDPQTHKSTHTHTHTHTHTQTHRQDRLQYTAPQLR